MRVPAAATLAALLAAIAGSSGCVRDGAPPVAPVDVAVGDVGDGGARPASISLGTVPARDRCTARLSPEAISTGPGCTLDERISKGAGTLLYPCSGTGPVEAIFAEHHFEGSVSDGALVLDLTTEIDWEDGCHWQTKQRIRGELQHAKRGDHADRGEHNDEPADDKLSWTYTEGPVSGTSCLGSCRASAEIAVEEPGIPGN